MVEYMRLQRTHDIEWMLDSSGHVDVTLDDFDAVAGALFVESLLSVLSSRVDATVCRVSVDLCADTSTKT